MTNLWTESRITRMAKEGRGQGEGSHYRPWLEAQEVSSLGLASRHFCPKTGRIHHFLSKGESDFYTVLAWHPDVTDIREQFPIPRNVTRCVAAELGIKHPYYPGTHVETVMTVDFMVTRIRNGEETIEAYDTKCAEDLQDPRTLEKLEITRAALAQGEIRHRIVCHESLPKRKVANLQWIDKGAVLPVEAEERQSFFDDYSQRMLLDVKRASKALRLNEYCASFDQRFAVKTGTGLRLARILMSKRELLPDLEQPELENAPLGSFSLAPALEQQRFAAGGSR